MFKLGSNLIIPLMYEATLKIGSDIKKSQFEYIEICGYMCMSFQDLMKMIKREIKTFMNDPRGKLVMLKCVHFCCTYETFLIYV